MAKLNRFFAELKREYIFPIIEFKLEALKKSHPHASIVNLGVGDIALPLAPSIGAEIRRAVSEMETSQGIRGYGPTEGYTFLREAIAQHQYASTGIEAGEIFISDGANPDTANFLELFDQECRIGLTDPTYPVYLDANILAGRGSRIELLPCLEENGFAPLFPKTRCDYIYLCTPNNPTGVALNRQQLEAWVEYAHANETVLLIDNAYEAFVTSPDIPKTVYEIAGAKEVAIEFRSFSKTAGFTGLRCAYTIVPKATGALHSLWAKRQAIKTNGVSYPIQRGAAAVFSPQGKKETQGQIANYLAQANLLKRGLSRLGHTCFGGIDSPYVWWKTPRGMKSWEFFDQLLRDLHLISIPGSGFGAHGEGFVRLSAFTTPQKTELALSKICALT